MVWRVGRGTQSTMGKHGCVGAALICGYGGLTSNCVKGCRGGGEFLCCEGYGCCECGGQTLSVVCCDSKTVEGSTRCSLPCCLFGLKKPDVCFNSNVECCWGFGVGSCPMNENTYQQGMICALCFYTCSGKGLGRQSGCMADVPERKDFKPKELPFKDSGDHGVQAMER
jgi:hypothetical protein